MNEIVTLERCLQDEASINVSIRSILRKLANECVFVEPNRKQRHLNRKDNEKRRDKELSQQAQILRESINHLSAETETFRTKSSNLIRHRDETLKAIDQMQRSIMLIENTYDLAYKQFDLIFERTHFSFNRSLATIRNKIPRFMNALEGSQLVRQIEKPPINYKKLLWELVKNGEHYQRDKQLASQLSYHLKRSLTNNLQNYHQAINSLHKDLTTIDEAFETDIPEEVRSFRSWNNHIGHLKHPLGKPSKRVTVVFHESSTSDQCELVSGAPEETEDPKFCELFTTLSEILKSHSFDAPKSRV